MHISLRYWSLLILALMGAHLVKSQTPTDAIMMSNGQICIAAIYAHETWDEYWEGTIIRANGNIGTFTRQSIMPMIALGLGNKINVIAALPYVFTKSSGGYLVGEKGFQDWGLWIKGTALDAHTTPGDLTIHGVLGMMMPLGGYVEDYAPY
ncbi:MAG: transporter, partial [Bacteroidota bacterium]|nr:transporter [Bacteroidota bacterium]